MSPHSLVVQGLMCCGIETIVNATGEQDNDAPRTNLVGVASRVMRIESIIREIDDPLELQLSKDNNKDK